MPNSNSIQIILDSPNNAFFANTTVNGKIILDTKKPIKARTFIVTILGYAKTNWIKEIKINKSRAEYKSLQFFIQKQILLWQSSESINTIPEGRHTFPIEFFIPFNCPPNLNTAEEIGNICYIIKAEINIPWKVKNKKSKLEFSVCPLIDLNLRGRELFTSATSFTACESSNKIVKVSVKIPKVGYVCGEIIPLQIGIENKSSSTVTSIEVGIEGIYTFTGECLNPPPTALTTDTKTLSKIFNLPKIKISLEKDEEIGLCQNVEIPALPPSYDECGFIKIYYRIFTKVHTNAFFSGGTTVSVPIVIGTVPLNADLCAEFFPPPEYKLFVRSQSDASEPYISPPPPTSDSSNMNKYKMEFREIKVERDIGSDFGSFQPKYPYFLNVNFV
uniref:Arrestin C-terminal-like domain-containing protein n=1 Tax=Panagrolaimus sp. PS1159 TaxID=55785 RepID=A0AC35GRL4_9BILA